MNVPNQVQLITYADSLGGNLRQLGDLLENELAGLFGAIHILPPFPSSGDRGFAPIDYREIAPAFGSWQDIVRLSEKRLVLLDIMVNHVSRRSPMFQDFLRNGESSPYADFFLTPRKVWGSDNPPPGELERLVLRRPRPWSDYPTADGGSVRVWTTFGATDPSEQIDLDVTSPKVRAYYRELFRFFGEQGVSMVRLDAVGYVTKKPGTSCFFVEPEMSEFLRWAVDAARECGVELLNEIHAEAHIQNRLARQGFWVYDFLLPFTVLHTLEAGDSGLLYRVLQDRPENQITMLDCHDGVPLQPDMDGWVTDEEAWRVVRACEKRGARFTRHHKEDTNSQAPDVHQICGTYYSLLGGNDDAYVAARAIQLFVPGIPQVYYVGLLAGEHDGARWEETGDDRELNRHNFTREEVRAHVDRPVVKRLMELIRLRNTHPAFQGAFSAVPQGDAIVRLEWHGEGCACELTIDLKSMRSRVACSGGPQGNVQLEL